MTKTKTLPALTEPVQGDLFGAATVHAEKVIEEVKKIPEAPNFLEVHFNGKSASAIVKIGNSVFKINN